MNDKQILWDQFGSYEEKMADLQSQIREMNTERREWIDKNRKNIRDHLMPKHGCFYELILPSPVKQWTEPRPLSMAEQCHIAHSPPGTYGPVEEIKKFSFEGCNECELYGVDMSAYYGRREHREHFDDNDEPILPRYVKIDDGKLYNTLHKEWSQNYPQIKGYLLDSNFEPYYQWTSCSRFCITHLGERVTKEKSSNVKPTNVYVMIDKNTGLYKIGRSNNPTRREKTLQSEKPTIELLFHNSGFHFDETALHRKFADKRVRGEWFKLDADDLSEVKSYFADKEDTQCES
jgi:hypothetical protein